MSENSTPETSNSAPHLVHLIQCGRRACSHVLTEDEREWTAPEGALRRRTAICPQCGCDNFYTLNESGQSITFRDREKYRNGLNPADIEPSPRLGPKMKNRLLAVKARIIQQATVKE